MPKTSHRSRSGSVQLDSAGPKTERRVGIAGGLKWATRQLSGLNLLLVFVPLGYVARQSAWSALLISAFNFLAIIPLSAIISDACDTLTERFGPLVGGLINSTFANVVELIVGILAIRHDEISLAQSTMLGSVLSNILLVQGCGIIAAARGTGVLSVNAAVVDSMSSLMLIAAVALILPTVLYSTSPSLSGGSEDIKDKILVFSRATAAVLLLIYVVYLYFELWTHRDQFLDDSDCVDHEAYGNEKQQEQQQSPQKKLSDNSAVTSTTKSKPPPKAIPTTREVLSAATILLSAAAVVVNCTHYCIENLDGMARALNISKTFVAIILIPMVSNACEFVQAVSTAGQKKIDFAITVIIGSILQLSLFVLPALVVAGWLMDRAMDLYFETSQTFILFLAVLIVNQVLQDGQYTYLHGVMLLSMYMIIMLAYFVEPYH